MKRIGLRHRVVSRITSNGVTKLSNRINKFGCNFERGAVHQVSEVGAVFGQTGQNVSDAINGTMAGLSALSVLGQKGVDLGKNLWGIFRKKPSVATTADDQIAAEQERAQA